MAVPRWIVLGAVAVAVATQVAPAAHAKGIASAEVCGADGCAAVTARAQASGDCRHCNAEQLMMMMPGSAHPTKRSAYYRIVLGFGMHGRHLEGRERVLFAPEQRLAARSNGRGGWNWFRLEPPALEIAARMIDGLRPYPAASMPFEPAADLPGTHQRATTDAGGGQPAASDGGSLLVPLGVMLAAAALALGGLGARRRLLREPAR